LYADFGADLRLVQPTGQKIGANVSKDVFKDLGFDAAGSAELHLRCELMEALLRILKKHGYTQKELVALLGLKQPHVSNLMRGKISSFSSEKLVWFLQALNAQVHVKVSIPRMKIAVGE
jgi:predicted XRE-type DNA-binding protein